MYYTISIAMSLRKYPISIAMSLCKSLHQLFCIEIFCPNVIQILSIILKNIYENATDYLNNFVSIYYYFFNFFIDTDINERQNGRYDRF